MGKQKEYSVPAIERAITILDTLTKRNLTSNKIHQELGIPKTSAFVILNTLEKHHLIEQKKDNTYKLGHRTFQWGMHFYNEIDLVRISRPFIEQLVENTPYTGHLAILTDNLPVYIDKVEGNGFVRFATSIGQQLPLHSSGVGKVLGVSLDEPSILAAIYRYRDTTDDAEEKFRQFKEDVTFIQKNGYSVEDEEMEDGIRCLAVPIYGPNEEILAAISITAISKDLPIVSFSNWAMKAKKAALEISKKLGYLKSDD
ncbi:IclR family transcriptional regulator [Lentibacillus salicampi]|nr:IclR family transcriptional regulator [Lentibacillus salicampi]